MSESTTLAEFTNVTDDAMQDVSAAREQALTGGARYRGSRSTPDAGAAIDGETTCCQQCGAAVSDRFRRVFGDINNVVWGCFDCYTSTAVKRGAASSNDCDGEMVSGGTSR